MGELRGLATGIGSLPHTDADAALDLVFQYLPNLPFWPQLPKLNIREGMVAQFSENLPFLKINDNGLFFSVLDTKDSELEVFYEHIISNDIDYFKMSEPYAVGLHKFYKRLKNADLKDTVSIKCQITGPFTFAACLTDDKGIALLHDPVILQAISKGLALKAKWQINLFREFGKKIILYIDEPYLACFGSAYTPIDREDVVRVLSELTEAISSEGVLLGVHCCGNTDWSMFMEVEKLDIISFDAFDFLDRLVLYAKDLEIFLKHKNGMLCWGIVPTQLFSGLETAEILIRKLKEGINSLVKKGLEEELLLENLLISPSCGLGTFSPEKADKIFKLLSETSYLIRKYS